MVSLVIGLTTVSDYRGLVMCSSTVETRRSMRSIASRNDDPPLLDIFISTVETAFSIRCAHLNTGRTRVWKMMLKAPTVAPTVMIHCANVIRVCR